MMNDDLMGLFDHLAIGTSGFEHRRIDRAGSLNQCVNHNPQMNPSSMIKSNHDS